MWGTLFPNQTHNMGQYDEEEMEKKVVVITSEENNAEIESLIGFVKGKGIVLTDQMNKAMDIAEKNVKAYLI